MIQTLSTLQLRNYITVYSSEDIRQAHQLWTSYTVRPGLVSMRNYSYNERNLQYRDERIGRRIPYRQISIDAVRFSQAIRDRHRELLISLSNGRISQQEWYDENLRLMKLSYYVSASVATGTDQENTNSEAWLLLLLLYFTRFNMLANQINTGEIIIGADTSLSRALLARIGMYGLNNKSAYENFRLQAAKRQGYSECRRIPGPSEHCKDSTLPGCDELIALGWMPISKMPLLGQTTCLSYCECSLDFRGRALFAMPIINQVRKPVFAQVRDKDGKLLFLYSAERKEIEIKHKWHSSPVLIDLTKY